MEGAENMVQLEGVICTGGGCNERRIRSGEDTIVTQKARTPRTPSALEIEETQRVQEKRKEGLLYRVFENLNANWPQS